MAKKSALTSSLSTTNRAKYTRSEQWTGFAMAGHKYCNGGRERRNVYSWCAGLECCEPMRSSQRLQRAGTLRQQKRVVVQRILRLRVGLTTGAFVRRVLLLVRRVLHCVIVVRTLLLFECYVMAWCARCHLPPAVMWHEEAGRRTT